MQSNIAQILKQARKNKNLKQGDLAKLTNLNRSVIAGYEANVHIPSLENFLKLAKVLDIDLNEIQFFKKGA